MLIGFDVAGWIGAYVNAVDHLGRHWVATMCEASLEGEYHEFFAWWAHVSKALPEEDDGEAGVFEVLARLDGSSPVVDDLADVKAGTYLFDVFFDGGVVHHLALGP